MAPSFFFGNLGEYYQELKEFSRPRIASSKIFSKRVSLHHIKIFSKREEKIKIGRPPERGKEVPHEDSKSYHEERDE